MSDLDLSERVQVLRDEVLDVVGGGDTDALAVVVFDAIVRTLTSGSESPRGLDVAFADSVSRRLAWGDTEETILSGADLVFARLARAAQRALRDPDDEIRVLEVAADVVAGAARVVALAAVARAGRDRAAALREDLAQRRLTEALAEQQRTLLRLEKAGV